MKLEKVFLIHFEAIMLPIYLIKCKEEKAGRRTNAENLISFRVFQPHRIENFIFTYVCIVKFLFELEDKGTKKIEA